MTKQPYLIVAAEVYRPTTVISRWFPRVYHLKCGWCDRDFTAWGIFGRIRCNCGSVNVVGFRGVGI